VTESEIVKYREVSKKTDEKYRKVITERNLENNAFYWTKEKSSGEWSDWGLSQCSIMIESSNVYGTIGLIYAIHFYVIGYEDVCDHEDIILGPKIEIGEPPRE
jgi:hypothetical protein